jgi:hypothetical protein
MISVLSPVTTGLSGALDRTSLVLADININPNSNGLPGITALQKIVGAVMTVGLILSVLALIVAAVVWAFGSHSANPHLATRGKAGVLIACGAAIVTGGAVAFINFFWNVGQGIWDGCLLGPRYLDRLPRRRQGRGHGDLGTVRLAR